jgi:energy-coupling factor transport system ATP-binding protein
LRAPAGQSTFLRVCGGMLRPDGGRLRVAAPRGFVFQNPDHQVVMPSAGGDVAFGLGRLGLPASEVAERVEAALAAVGLQVGGRGVARVGRPLRCTRAIGQCRTC